MAKRPFLKLLALFILTPVLSGCLKLALGLSPSLIPGITASLFEECDLELAKQSLPADLKLMEGLLKSDPENRELLTALCMGYSGYAMLFLEEDAPERASNLYLRARSYGFRALGPNAPPLLWGSGEKGAVQDRLKRIRDEELEALFWTTLSWNAWINLNLDRPGALAQFGTAQACLERVLEMNPNFFYGAPYILMGSVLAGRPQILGGNESEAKSYFEKAMNLTQGAFFLAPYMFARYYAVRVQDKELFRKLIEEIVATPAEKLKDICLINAAMKQKALRLKRISEDLFF
jgi:tetratricopeptide (TPR) repeat protein